MASRAPIDFQEPVEQPIGLRPALRPVPQTGFLENFTATQREMQIAGNIDATSRRGWEAYRPIIDELERVGAVRGQTQSFGRNIPLHFVNPYSLTDETQGMHGVGVPGQVEMRRLIHAEIVRRRRADPDFLREVPDTPEEYDRRIAERYSAELQRIRRVQGAASSLGSIGGFAGGVAGSFEDPINLATMPVGGASRTVIGAIGRSFIENAIIEAASQPAVRQNYAELGENQTFMDAARSVLFSGGAGAAFRGGAEAIGRAGPIYDALATSVFNVMPQSIQRRWADAATVDDRLLVDILRASISPDRWTPDLRASVNILERDAEIREASPFEPGPVGDQAHADALTGALRQIVDGAPPIRSVEPMEATPAPPARPAPGTGLHAGIVAGLRQRGFSETQAQGIAAGVEAESRSNYQIVNPTSGAYGIGQWLGSRKRELFRRYGASPTLDQQLDFMAWELRGGDHGGRHVLAETDPERVLDAYIRRFMRPAEGAETIGDLRRGRAALGVGERDVEPEMRMSGAPESEAVDMAAVPTVRSDLFSAPEARVEAQRAVASGLTGEAVEFEPARFAGQAGEMLEADPTIRTERLAQTLQITPDEARQVRALAEGEMPAVDAAARSDLPPAQGVPFREWVEEALGSRDWVVAARLGPKMAERFDVAVPPARFRELEATWRADNGNAVMGTVGNRIDEPRARADQLGRIIARAEVGGYGKRSRAVQNRARGELREIEAGKAVLADIRAGGDVRDLQQFDDPKKGGTSQSDSIEHDLRTALAADSAFAARKFVTEELGEASLDEILEDLDNNRAFAAAMRACL